MGTLRLLEKTNLKNEFFSLLFQVRSLISGPPDFSRLLVLAGFFCCSTLDF